jgi:NAD(P)-dependent dehydrogenase (short-subunit alcohol dehydrogenase family)
VSPKTFVISGGASGIGAAVTDLLQARGERVIVVDLRKGDVLADLSTESGCQHAIDALKRLAPEGLDGLIPCAGLGPHVTPVELIPRVNFFAATRLITGLHPLLKQKGGAVVVISSNSASLPGYHADYLQALAREDEPLATEIIAGLDGQSAYGGSKYALTVWMRKQAPAYMAEGIRMNAVAPGITHTAMTDGVFQDQQWGEAIRQFSDMTPCGRMATPEDIAHCILFLLDPVSAFVCGAVLFADGGTDALLRPDSF